MTISKANITSKNLNLLVIFNTLYETQHVSEAARRLKMSQPNLSRALKILREEFKDPLFVRSARGIVPTERAMELALPVQEALASIEKVYFQKNFDPAKATGKFTISTTDYIEFLLAPALADLINREAPNLTLNFRPSQGFLQKTAMETGECDLTILVLREAIPLYYYKQVLFNDPYLCAVRKKHPILAKKSSLDKFLEYGHAMISPQGMLWAITDDRLEKMGKTRRLVLGTPNCLSTAASVAKSDLILTATKRFIEGAMEFFPLETFKSPFEMDPIQIAQIWHERSNEDALNIWIRQKIKSLL